MGHRLTNGAVFLHIPKTGGSFITRFLAEQRLLAGEAGGMHDDIFRSLVPQNYASRAGRVIRELPVRVVGQLRRRDHDWTTGPSPEQPTAADLPWMFCFVRHPCTWVESYYQYAVRQRWYYWSSEFDYRDFWHPNAALNGLRSDTFNGFVEKLLRKRPGYVTEMFGWYTTAGVRFIGKQESLRADLATVLDELGLPYDRAALRGADKVNAAPDGDQALVWDPELRAEFLRCEYAGLRRYGYLTAP